MLLYYGRKNKLLMLHFFLWRKPIVHNPIFILTPALLFLLRHLHIITNLLTTTLHHNPTKILNQIMNNKKTLVLQKLAKMTSFSPFLSKITFISTQQPISKMFILINFGYKTRKIFTIDCLAAALFDCIW